MCNMVSLNFKGPRKKMRCDEMRFRVQEGGVTVPTLLHLEDIIRSCCHTTQYTVQSDVTAYVSNIVPILFIRSHIIPGHYCCFTKSLWTVVISLLN